MHIPLPGGFAAVFISLCLFYYYNQKVRAGKENMREKRKRAHEEFLQSLLKDKEKETLSSEEEEHSDG